MGLDLNSDLGEGFGAWRMGDDAAVLDIVTSANVACGFHAGDPAIMRRTCELAVQKGVRIGAHIGYRDLVGFGRRTLAVAPGELRDETLYQIGALDGFARAAGDRVRYVKPHGALYHAAAAQPVLADAVVAAIREFDSALTLLGPAGTHLQESAALGGIRFVSEGFADRAYTATGGLARRDTPGAVLDADTALAQAVTLAETGTARIAGAAGTVTISPDSICVHGDTPDAVQLARRIRTTLADAGIAIASFT